MSNAFENSEWVGDLLDTFENESVVHLQTPEDIFMLEDYSTRMIVAEATLSQFSTIYFNPNLPENAHITSRVSQLFLTTGLKELDGRYFPTNIPGSDMALLMGLGISIRNNPAVSQRQMTYWIDDETSVIRVDNYHPEQSGTSFYYYNKQDAEARLMDFFSALARKLSPDGEILLTDCVQSGFKNQADFRDIIEAANLVIVEQRNIVDQLEVETGALKAALLDAQSDVIWVNLKHATAETG